MPLWTDYGNSLSTIYEEYFTSMKSYNHDTLTLTVHIEGYSYSLKLNINLIKIYFDFLFHCRMN